MALILTMASCASLETLTRNSPRAVPQEPVYNFGFAGPEQEITHGFMIKNTGNSPLSIENTSTECGCIIISSPHEKIAPNHHGKVEVECRTMPYEGYFEKHATLSTNDHRNPEIRLTIKGSIKRNAMVTPQAIVFGKVKKGEILKKSVNLYDLSANKLNIKKIEADYSLFHIETSWFHEENKKGYRIDVTLKPDLPEGRLNEVITLHTDLKKRPRIDLMVWADIN